MLQRRVEAPWLAGHGELSAEFDGTRLGADWANVAGKDPATRWMAGIRRGGLDQWPQSRAALEAAPALAILEAEPLVTRDTSGSLHFRAAAPKALGGAGSGRALGVARGRIGPEDGDGGHP